MQRRDRLVVLAATVPQSANPSSGFVIGPDGRCLVGSLAWRCHGHQRTRSAANREVQSSGARIRSAVSGGQPRPTSWATLAVSMSRLSAACCASASGRPSRRSTRKRHAVTLGSGFGRGDQVGALIDGLVARSSAVLPCLGMAGDCGFRAGSTTNTVGRQGFVHRVSDLAQPELIEVAAPVAAQERPAAPAPARKAAATVRLADADGHDPFAGDLGIVLKRDES